MADKLTLEITVDDKGSPVIKYFKGNVQAAAGDISQAATTAGGGFQKLWKDMALGSIAANALTVVTNKVIAFGDASIDAFLESTKESARLRNTVKSFGDETGESYRQLVQFAKSVQNVARVDDDMVQGLMALGLNMKIDRQEIEKATQTAFGLSKVFDIDVTTAMRATAAMYEGNTEKLRRYLPELANMKDEMAMFTVVQEAGARGWKQFGDESGEAFAKVETFKVKMGEFQETIGKVLVEAFLPALENIGKWIEENKNSIVELLTQILELLSQIGSFIGGVLEGLFTIGKTAATVGQLFSLNAQLSNIQQKYWEDLKKTETEEKRNLDIKTRIWGEVAKHREEYKLLGDAITGAVRAENVEVTVLGHAKDAHKKFNKACKEAQEALVELKFALGNYAGAIENAGSAIVRFNSLGEEEKRILYDVLQLQMSLIGIALPQFSTEQENLNKEEKEQAELLEVNARAMQNFQDKVAGVTGVVANLASGLAECGIISEDTANLIGDAVSKIGSAIASAASGDIAGAISSAWDYSPIGSFFSFLAADQERAVEDSIDLENAWMNLTDDQVEQLKELIDVYDDVHAATSMMLADIIASADITDAASLDQYAARMHEILSDFDNGLLTLGETTDAIGSSFQELVNLVDELNLPGATGEMIATIKDLRSRNIEVAEVTQYVMAEVDKGVKALGGYLKYAKENQEAFAHAQLYTAQLFAQSVRENGFLAAVSQYGEILDEMLRISEEKGYLISDVLADALGIRAFMQVSEANANMIEGVSSLDQVIQSLGNTGLLTMESFAAAQEDVVAQYNAMLAGGMEHDLALQTSAQSLAHLWWCAQQYGYTLDSVTASLVAEAQANGQLNSMMIPATDKIVSCLETIVELLGGTIPYALDNLITQTQTWSDVLGNSIGSFTTLSNGTLAFVGKADIYAQSGFSGYLPEDTTIHAHRGEYAQIIPANQVSAWSGGGSSGGGSEGGGVRVERLDFNFTIVNDPSRSPSEQIIEDIRRHKLGIRQAIKEAANG